MKIAGRAASAPVAKATAGTWCRGDAHRGDGVDRGGPEVHPPRGRPPGHRGAAA
eukprot:CAMPEP_0194741264 /NCGR_PEP_ID=MMETSP0296-20130528/95606_1 /TAXON_ID=39354 /ORGANISM="Heterosigma akashiwo, Strain CCMP2393" /LENGTH=53 /DNA_ID=CAMNT_0039652717 /DNA_START=257 /DNA_END=414 /DNA_ORIENTATION=-